MRSVVFRLHSNVSPERQDAVLAEIDAMQSVHTAARLTPEAQNTDIRRLCYAYVKDEANIQEVVSELQQLPEVEAASVAAQRKLI